MSDVNDITTIFNDCFEICNTSYENSDNENSNGIGSFEKNLQTVTVTTILITLSLVIIQT